MRVEREDVAFEVEDRIGFWEHQFPRWEMDMIPTIRLCPIDWTFLDLGAWCGPWTLSAAALGRRVRAFEPDPVAFADLDRNLSLNPDLSRRVTAYNAAVSDSTGETTLTAQSGILGASMTSRFAVDDPEYPDRPFKVKTYDVAEFIDRDATFVKIDIEGDELTVFPVVAELGAPCHLSIHAGLTGARHIDFKRALVPSLARYRAVYYANHRYRPEALPWTRNFEVTCLP